MSEFEPHLIADPKPFTLSKRKVENWTGGKWIGPKDDVVIRGTAIDSRAVHPQSLFVCLAGSRADGHDFAAMAVSKGAVFVLASREVQVGVPVLVVDDVVSALGRLATEFRKSHKGATWIGVTGSSGKTTTKELIAAACSAAVTDQVVHATRGNLNNHIGVPMTVLATPENAAYCVIEMGANNPGEIANLTAIVQPQVGIIVSIGPAHLEGFGTLLGVARAKSELFAGLPAKGQALIGVTGLDAQARGHGFTAEQILNIVKENVGERKLTQVGSDECPVLGEQFDDGIIVRTEHGEARLQLLGAHNLANAALAVHAARAAGVAQAKALAGLGAVTPMTGRLRMLRAHHHTLIDDSYNANPASMIAGLHVLARYNGKRLAVLGAMGELGAKSDDAHRQVGAEVAHLGLPLLTIGERARLIGEGYLSSGGQRHLHADTHVAGIACIAAECASEPTTVLVKASRSSGLDQVVKGLVAALLPVAKTSKPHSAS
jgi:UDP-N-acetylmuramoyl-tripeptide--D-alanyl-D-alanine ligase